MASTRIEKDFLGERELPAQALYGINTLRAVENSPLTGRTIASEPAFVTAMTMVKQAAAEANAAIGALPKDVANHIVAACTELRRGGHDADLVVDVLDGSGGTSMNMNINEVVANLAAADAGKPLGDYRFVHPNDHVNLGQSTNDSVPTAMEIAVYHSTEALVAALRMLADELGRKQQAFAKVLRLGRTCLQDAQPMTLGQAFGGYAGVVRRHAEILSGLRAQFLTVPLCGTAIGTGLGRRAGYKEAVFGFLSALVGAEVKPADDPFDAMQNLDKFMRFSAELRSTSGSLWKIANDLMVLSSGPAGGIGEITLPALQAGSSIMPGKVNPVIPIAICEIAHAIAGNDATVAGASREGSLEINCYDPVILDRTLDSISLLTHGAALFAEKCIRGLLANEERAMKNLLASSAIATALVPKLGYTVVSRLVREALAAGRPFLEVAVEKGHLREEEIRPALFMVATDPTKSQL